MTFAEFINFSESRENQKLVVFTKSNNKYVTECSCEN